VKLNISKYTFLIVLVLALFGYFAFNFQTERFLNKKSIEFTSAVFPKFNPKIINYGTYECDNIESGIKLDPNLKANVISQGPVTKITISYMNIFKKNYFLNCVDKRVSPVSITNADGKRSEFNLMDTIVIQGQVNDQYNGTIVLRDSLGTPIWWLATNSPTIAAENYVYLRDPKLIEGGHKVLFVGSKKPAGVFSSDGEYLVYNLLTHKVEKSYTGAKTINAEGTLDFHDLQVFPNGEAVGIRYARRTDVDLSSIGIPKGIEILDSEIVFLNKDGTEKFKYSLLDRIDISEIATNQPAYYNPGAAPVDVIHSNSVEIAGDSVIISSRHLDAVHKMRISDGEIVWKLGGHGKTKYDLDVLNEYGAFNQSNNTIDLNHLLSGQHDARITKDGGVSIFDNGTTSNRNPRVLTLSIDEKNMKAKITQVVTGSSQSISSCCGTARELKDGAWLVNWGGKLDQQRGTFANGVSSTVLPNGVATRILVRPTNVFSYRVIPYYLTSDQVKIFRNDLINR
jgi:hypothetical protein